MNWTTLGITFVICGSAFSLALTIAVKIIGNKVRKQLPECSTLFTQIQAEIKEMKQGSTDRLKMTAALEAAMELNKEQYRELHTEFKNFTTEIKEICINIGQICRDIKYMSDAIGELKGIGKK